MGENNTRGRTPHANENMSKKMRERGKKCKSKNSVGERKNKGLLHRLLLNNRHNRIQRRFWGPTDVVFKP